MADFPEAEFQRFVFASEEADGHFIANYGGTLKYGIETDLQIQHETAKINPRAFLATDEPKLSYPYETWGMGSVNNHVVSARLKDLYEDLHTRLASLYERRGLTATEASRAAKTAVFASVLGADCGGAESEKSLRRLLLEHGSLQEIGTLIASEDWETKPEAACWNFAPADPMLHVAVTYPAALPLILDHERDTNKRNQIGKTALMVAARFDALESARFLLAHQARVNATTWQHADSALDATLSYDARTPLMYAAANASLPMIKLLLDAGADPYEADTKGRRAMDYLLGFGPVPANPKLTPEQLAEAARLLF